MDTLPIRVVLDDEGNCFADLVKPSVWHVVRMDPFGHKHVVILTSATLQFLAGKAEEYDGIIR